MNKEVDRLTAQLSKLSIKRLEVISELQTINKEHYEVEQLLEDLKKINRLNLQLVGTNTKGNSLRVGDNVTTLTKTTNKLLKSQALIQKIILILNTRLVESQHGD